MTRPGLPRLRHTTGSPRQKPTITTGLSPTSQFRSHHNNHQLTRPARLRTSSSFATFLIVGPACFFLGILFSLLPYDYYVIWSLPKSFPIGHAFDTQERHLRFLHSSPPLISRMVNIVVAVGLLGFFVKLYKPKETNMLFDGASLVLYMIALVVYLTNFVKGLQVIATGVYGDASSASASTSAPGIDAATSSSAGPDFISREDSLRLMAASNTIMALLLVGVLVLQAGQWYAARSEEDDLDKKESEGSESGKSRLTRKRSQQTRLAFEKAAAAPSESDQ